MTAAPPAGLHWHAYSYTGQRGHLPDHEREAPLDAAEWLRRPAGEIVATLETPEDAEAWMRRQLELNPPAEAEEGHAVALLYLRMRLYAEHSPPWASYIDRHGRHLLRYLAPCPLPAWARPFDREKPPPPCPLGEPAP